MSLHNDDHLPRSQPKFEGMAELGPERPLTPSKDLRHKVAITDNACTLAELRDCVEGPLDED
jgi:hypothetical protein